MLEILDHLIAYQFKLALLKKEVMLCLRAIHVELLNILLLNQESMDQLKQQL